MLGDLTGSTTTVTLNVRGHRPPDEDLYLLCEALTDSRTTDKAPKFAAVQLLSRSQTRVTVPVEDAVNLALVNPALDLRITCGLFTGAGEATSALAALAALDQQGSIQSDSRLNEWTGRLMVPRGAVGRSVVIDLGVVSSRRETTPSDGTATVTP